MFNAQAIKRAKIPRDITFTRNSKTSFVSEFIGVNISVYFLGLDPELLF
jgi:hypothetical protein